MRRHPALAVVPLLLLLAACGSDEPEENTAQACEAADEFATALNDLEGTLSPSATVEEIRDARDAAGAAHERLDESAEDVAEDRVGALDDAWEQLSDAVQDIDDDMTVSAAVDSLRDDVAQIRAARDDLTEQMAC